MNSVIGDPLGVSTRSQPKPPVAKPEINIKALVDVDQSLGRVHSPEQEGSKLRWSFTVGNSSCSTRPKQETTELSTYFEPLDGEVKQRVCPVRVRVPESGWRRGRLVATNYRIRIVLPKGETPEEDTWLLRTSYLDIPWGCIREIQQDQNSTGVRIGVWTKDRRQLVIDIIDPDLLTSIEMGNALIVLASTFAWPTSMHHLFAFAHAEKRWNSGVLEGLDGWQIYDPLREYGRMDLDCERPAKGAPWYICSMNVDYTLCESYPAWIVIPKRFPVEELYTAADFRKKNRLPVMSWCSPHLNYAALFRSSQSTEGVVGQRSSADEHLMLAIAAGTGQSEKMMVVDLRPKKTALAQKVIGGGMEDSNTFRLHFGNIENIHHVRSAYLAMAQAVQNALAPGVGTWFQEVASSKWYDLIGALLDVAVAVATEMSCCRSVLVHCSDGWDRTAQTTSLVMIILDPFYRTVSGFFCLIQKEFCCFGHRFRTRLANGERASAEYSPIFFQWLDAVYQIINQNANSFEFSPALLPQLAHEAITNKYGTFLCDTEKEMCSSVMPHTMSVWTEFLQPDVCRKYSNPNYAPTNTRLILQTNQVMYKIWDDFWFQRTPLHAVKTTHPMHDLKAPSLEVTAPAFPAPYELPKVTIPDIEQNGASPESKNRRKLAQPWDFDRVQDPFA